MPSFPCQLKTRCNVGRLDELILRQLGKQRAKVAAVNFNLAGTPLSHAAFSSKPVVISIVMSRIFRCDFRSGYLGNGESQDNAVNYFVAVDKFFARNGLLSSKLTLATSVLGPQP
jgi:hypothetical protein